MSTDDTRPLTEDLGMTSDESPEPRPTEDTTTDEAAQTPAVVHRTGPAPFALLLGMLGLAVAAAVLIAEVVDVAPRWSVVGPWAVVGGGVFIVVVGLLGLRSNRGGD